MEDISPTLVLVWDLLSAFESGQSITSGVQAFLQRPQQSGFAHSFKKSWHQLQNDPQTTLDESMTWLQRQLFEIVKLGHRGESVYDALKSLEAELIWSCEDEINRHVALLPFKMMIPLLAFIMPALLIVLLAPLIAMIQF